LKNLQNCDRVWNREDVFERRVPSGPIADEHNVVVGIDDAGDHGFPLQVKTPHVCSLDGEVVTHSSETAVLDQCLRGDAVTGVHRVDPAVDYEKVRGARRICRRRLREQFRAGKSAEGQRAGLAEELSAQQSVCRLLFRHAGLLSSVLKVGADDRFYVVSN